MTSFRDPYVHHTALVDLVSPIAPPPKAWTELRERFDDFTDFEATPLLQRLIEAVVTGGDDMPMLRAAAYSEAYGERVDVVVEVRGAVYPRLIALYSKVAAANYAKVAKEFDATASDFTAATVAGNPEAASESVVGQPNPVRDAWLDAAKHAARLDQLTPILSAAAELAGISTADDIMLLPLVCDPAELHRRRVWEAWKANGARTGHWGALATLGARIRACPIEELGPYRQPQALIRRQLPVGGADSRGVYKAFVIDPEDEDFVSVQAAVEQRRRELSRR